MAPTTSPGTDPPKRCNEVSAPPVAPRSSGTEPIRTGSASPWAHSTNRLTPNYGFMCGWPTRAIITISPTGCRSSRLSRMLKIDPRPRDAHHPGRELRAVPGARDRAHDLEAARADGERARPRSRAGLEALLAARRGQPSLRAGARCAWHHASAPRLGGRADRAGLEAQEAQAASLMTGIQAANCRRAVGCPMARLAQCSFQTRPSTSSETITITGWRNRNEHRLQGVRILEFRASVGSGR